LRVLLRIKPPLLVALVAGYSAAGAGAVVGALRSSKASSQFFWWTTALVCLLTVAFQLRARVVLREGSIEVRRLLRSTTILYPDIVRSIVIFDPFDEAILGLHVQRSSGPAVRIDTGFWSNADRRRLFAVAELRVEHHDGSERYL